MSGPILFQPLEIRGITIPNRIVVSPMCQYTAQNGYPTAHHTVHYGKFALGGAGLVFIEATGVTQNGRITNGCLGLWEDGQAVALQPITQFLKEHGAVPAIQIGHAGRKSSMQRPWHGNGPQTADDVARGDVIWEALAPSALPLDDGWIVPTALTQDALEDLKISFAEASKRAVTAGFEVVEIHMAHGYLLQSFLSPLSNKRTDEYGGSLAGRLRFPLEIVDVVRAALPEEMPLFVRISAVDGIEGGWDMDDSVAFAKELKARGVDVIDCSSGGNSPKGATNSSLKKGAGYQAAYAARIKEEAQIMTQAVGLIRSAEFAEGLLQDGAADLIAVGRQFLYDPFWAVHAAEKLGLTGDFESWPEQYGWWLEKWEKGLHANGEAP